MGKQKAAQDSQISSTMTFHLGLTAQDFVRISMKTGALFQHVRYAYRFIFDDKYDEDPRPSPFGSPSLLGKERRGQFVDYAEIYHHQPSTRSR